MGVAIVRVERSWTQELGASARGCTLTTSSGLPSRSSRWVSTLTVLAALSKVAHQCTCGTHSPLLPDHQHKDIQTHMKTHTASRCMNVNKYEQLVNTFSPRSCARTYFRNIFCLRIYINTWTLFSLQFLSISIYLFLSLSFFLYVSFSLSFLLYLTLSLSYFLYLALSLFFFIYLAFSLSFFLPLSPYLSLSLFISISPSLFSSFSNTYLYFHNTNTHTRVPPEKST